MLVDISCDKVAGSFRTEKEVVDPEPGISAKSVSEIVPECVDLLVGMKMPQSIRPPLLNKRFEGVSRFDAEECVVFPPLRFVNVEFCRHDIVIADKDR